MFKSDIPCKGRGETCSNLYIQNKNKHLCADCVFELNHDGKTKQEVYSERSKKKLIPTDSKLKSAMSSMSTKAMSKFLTEEEQMFENNKRVLDGPNVEDEGEKKFERQLNKKKYKSIKKKSPKQAEIDLKYKLVCADMDYTTEPVCSGCLQYQGGNIKLSHSHIISRQDCHNIGKPELISNRENLTYHCMDFSEQVGCHSRWENPSQRHLLEDYKQNIEFIKKKAPELVEKYSSGGKQLD